MSRDINETSPQPPAVKRLTKAKCCTKQEIENSPSRRDGMDARKELETRRAYASLIQEAGISLRLPQWAIATAILFCHRFYAVKSMRKNDKTTIATACLLLAAKAEESPKPVRDVIYWCERLRLTPQQARDPQHTKRLKEQGFVDETKELIFQAERAVLYTLGFDLNLEHPYKFLLKKFREFSILNVPPDSPYKHLMQVSWNFVNDSLRTTLCLQYPPDQIATAALYFAKEALKLELPPKQYSKESFWEHFRVDTSSITDIVKQMLDMWESLKLGKPVEHSEPYSEAPTPSIEVSRDQDVKQETKDVEAMMKYETKLENCGPLANSPGHDQTSLPTKRKLSSDTQQTVKKSPRLT